MLGSFLFSLLLLLSHVFNSIFLNLAEAVFGNIIFAVKSGNKVSFLPEFEALDREQTGQLLEGSMAPPFPIESRFFSQSKNQLFCHDKLRKAFFDGLHQLCVVQFTAPFTVPRFGFEDIQNAVKEESHNSFAAIVKYLDSSLLEFGIHYVSSQLGTYHRGEPRK
mmetsp:Transcript_48560/g.126012  ORF Transcript_48560/g.126012 Transcript_48560/m.126012 type:complete len:164 (-) Transcript_48560:633-1124(-)